MVHLPVLFLLVLVLNFPSVANAKGKFKPTKLSGPPVKVMGVIQYNFVAQRKAPNPSLRQNTRSGSARQ